MGGASHSLLKHGPEEQASGQDRATWSLGERVDAPTSVRDLKAVLTVSEAVARAGDLDTTLALVARTAGDLLETQSCAVLLRDAHRADTLRVAAAVGLSDDYIHYLNTSYRVRVGQGPSGTALATLRPVTVDDTESVRMFEPWLKLARIEGYHAMVSVPLVIGEDVLGVLNLYRRQAVQTSERELRLLVAVSAHAAIAIRNAQLIETSERQLESLRSLVVSLRAQAHEFSNRLHAIGGLLALGEIDKARSFLGEVECSFDRSYEMVTRCIEEVSIAGFLLAQKSLAAELGVEFTLDSRSSLAVLPAGMATPSVITVIGNLLANAFDVASDLTPDRRRVTLRISQTPHRTRIIVRDRGRGLGDIDPSLLFKGGYTTKPGHVGVGLTLVTQEVAAVHGRIAVGVDGYGWTRFNVDLPGSVPEGPKGA